MAAFSARVAAWIIDAAVITLYYYLMILVIYPFLQMDEAISTSASLFFITLPVILYQLSFEIMLNGQTPGKMALGIKIIDREGNEPTWGQYITRWLLSLGNIVLYVMPKYLIHDPAYFFIFMLVYIPDVVVLFISPKRQRIGDLAAGTAVIDARYKANITDTIYKQIEVQHYTPMFPQVMNLTDRDINGISQLLAEAKPDKARNAYMNEVVRKIKKVLAVETSLEGPDFLRQLLFDYNFLAGR